MTLTNSERPQTQLKKIKKVVRFRDEVCSENTLNLNEKLIAQPLCDVHLVESFKLYNYYRYHSDNYYHDVSDLRCK